MTARDLVKERRDSYTAGPQPRLVDVPPLLYLVVHGTGAPADVAFTTAVSALYSVAYSLRFLARGNGLVDYKVPPLEALWDADSPEAFLTRDTKSWKWTLLSALPDEIDEEIVGRARSKAALRCGEGVDAVRLERIVEGRSAQVLHRGPYDSEGPTIQRLHSFIAGAGLHPRAQHHEIYLSDPRRTRPDRIRTIIRQPVEAEDHRP